MSSLEAAASFCRVLVGALVIISTMVLRGCPVRLCRVLVMLGRLGVCLLRYRSNP